MDGLQGMHQLDRVVLDECHAPLDNIDEFQPKMQQLGDRIEKGVADGLFDGNVPPHAEPEFMNIMRIKVDDVHMF